MMNPCKNCNKNKWTFVFNDGVITATCFYCHNSVNFKAKQKDKRVIDKSGDLCKKCNFPVIEKISKFKKEKLKRPYYYTAYFLCQKCNTKYMNDRYKVVNEDVCKKNIEDFIAKF